MTLFQSEYYDHVKIKYILDAVNMLYKRKRRPKYTNEYLVKQILDCNLNYNTWSSYGKTLNKYTNKPKFHHKYLNEIYLKWSRLNIFELAYKNIINENLNYNPDILKLNTDVTCISNKYGSEKIGVNPEYPKKNVTKLALLNTLNNTPIGVNIIENKQILKTHKTLCHDKTSLQPLLNKLLVNTKNKGNIHINADKAYISAENYYHKNKIVEVVTPPRTKSIAQAKKEIKKISKNIELKHHLIYKYNTKYGNDSKNLKNCYIKIKELMNKINELNEYIITCNNKNSNNGSRRYLIENYFCSLKRIPKLYTRTDKIIKTFMSTVFIGLLYNYKINV